MLRNILILTIYMSMFGSWIEDPINIGSFSFIDAQWDNIYNISYSKQNISDITSNNKAVVLFFFYACMS